jgi:hypothetical protein
MSRRLPRIRTECSEAQEAVFCNRLPTAADIRENSVLVGPSGVQDMSRPTAAWRPVEEEKQDDQGNLIVQSVCPHIAVISFQNRQVRLLWQSNEKRMRLGIRASNACTFLDLFCLFCDFEEKLESRASKPVVLGRSIHDPRRVGGGSMGMF